MSETLTQLRESRERGELGAFLRQIPYARFLGLDLDLAGDELRCRLDYSDAAIGNPLLPALHGGVICALLETSALLQIAHEVELVALPKTITMTVSYLRSGRPQDTYAAARLTRQGRRVTSVQVEAWQDDRSAPIALASGQFLIPNA